MAGPGLRTSGITSGVSTGAIADTYAVHGIVNEIDTGLGSAINGQMLVSNGSEFAPLAGQVIVRWNSTTDAWDARPTGAPFGVLFLSTNDATATAPADAGLQVGDVWRRHPDAT